MSVRVISTPIGLLRLSGTDEALREVRRIDVPEPEVCPEALERTALELDEYFAGRRTAFTVTPAPQGTAFQRAVWRELTAVPYGQTLTYGALAARIGRPGAARAGGQAVGANPCLIVIPCHRVLAKTGLGGFACGLERKKTLLAIEGVDHPQDTGDAARHRGRFCVSSSSAAGRRTSDCASPAAICSRPE